MSLVSDFFINSLWLNILDRIVLANAYTVEICNVLLNCVGKFFHVFIIYYLANVYYVHAFVYKV